MPKCVCDYNGAVRANHMRIPNRKATNSPTSIPKGETTSTLENLDLLRQDYTFM